MTARAVLRYSWVAPRKAQLVADLIRGKNVSEALHTLTLTPKKPARIIKKVLQSAIANNEGGKDVGDMDRLTVKEIRVDPGPMMKRYIPRARGRATPIRKRTSHITIVLGEG